ncbi:MAG: hypothetical protein A2Y38_22755 [Spirochaetes bacterium GWB1_59_5]|nr:MAG: hypothetical protein A2Y38_22755 [Spirochaetes bacterium GWB1_59_5]
MKFSVKQKRRDGRVVESVLEADSQDSCERAVADKGALVISIRRVDSDSKTTKRRRSSADITEFTSIVATLLSSSLGVRDALAIVRNVAERPGVVDLASRLSARLEKGQEFSAAIAVEGEGLPPIYLSLVKIGERTGDLAKSFSRLDEYMADKRKVRQALIGSLMYPAVILCVLVIGVIGVSVYVLPRLTLIFSALGGSATEAVASSMARASAVFGAFAWILGLSAAAIVALVTLRKTNAAAKASIDAVMLKIPIIGRYFVDAQTLDFAFAMEALTNAGIPLDEALGEAAMAATNAAFAGCIARGRDNVRRGKPLSEAFAAETSFPRHVVQWLAVGERTGRVSEIFTNIRLFYQKAVSMWTSRFVGLVEPAVSVIVGVVIVSIVMLFILPLFTAYGSVL